jgi:hypothetical protein
MLVLVLKKGSRSQELEPLELTLQIRYPHDTSYLQVHSLLVHFMILY